MGCGGSTQVSPKEPLTDSSGTATAAAVFAAAAAPASSTTDVRKAAASPLRSLFNSMDVDGNGYVSQAELRSKIAKDDEIQKLLTAAGGDGSSHVWEQLDDDGDGKITWAEFEGMLSPDSGAFVDVVAGPGTAAPEEDDKPVDLKALFKSIDVDGDGTITKAELRKKLAADNTVQKLLTKMGGDGNSHVFEQLDEDDSGTITWEEFESMLSEEGGVWMDLAVSGSAAP